MTSTEFRNVAIVAHVDHGKTTLVNGMLEQSGVAMDKRSNVVANDDDYRTSNEKIYVAGDMRRGQSLVVWASREGRQAARSIDIALTGASVLPR